MADNATRYAVKLSEEYEAGFADLIITTLNSPGGRRTRTDLAAGWPAFGVAYRPRTGLMVVGRAPNGLHSDALPRGPVTLEGARHASRAARQYGEAPDNGLPLSWIAQPYNAEHGGGTVGTRSAFWRVAKRIAQDLKMVDEGVDRWWDSIAWSNLYKIAPRCRGNPANGLRAAQTSTGIPLVLKEVQEARPAVVLVIAGEGWYEPLEQPVRLRPCPPSQHLCAAGRSDETIWLVTRRPEAKHGGETPFVEAAVSALRREMSRQ